MIFYSTNIPSKNKVISYSQIKTESGTELKAWPPLFVIQVGNPGDSWVLVVLMGTAYADALWCSTVNDLREVIILSAQVIQRRREMIVFLAGTIFLCKFEEIACSLARPASVRVKV